MSVNPLIITYLLNFYFLNSLISSILKNFTGLTPTRQYKDKLYISTGNAFFRLFLKYF